MMTILKSAEKIFSLAQEREVEVSKIRDSVRKLDDNKENKTLIVGSKTAKQKEIEYEIRKCCRDLLTELY